MARRAFTLVELLVVIAIIALLISILAPSLKTAKELTKQMICMTHLRNIALASQLYAESNGGKLPPWGIDGIARTDRPPGYHNPPNCYHLATTYLFDDSGRKALLADDGTFARDGPLSYLHYYKYVPTDMLYCPLQLNQRYAKSSYPEPYGIAPADQPHIISVHISCGYMFNTVLHQESDGQWYWTYSNLAEYSTEGVLAVDILLRYWEVAHTWTGQTTPTWAMVYADGHSAAKVGARTYAHMYNYLEGSGYWYNPAWQGWNTSFGYLVDIPNYAVSP